MVKIRKGHLEGLKYSHIAEITRVMKRKTIWLVCPN